MIAYADLKHIFNSPLPTCEFEVLNELKDLSNRSDSNCLYHTRFIFECDDVDKAEQIEKANELSKQGVIVRATDSGNKSIHCIVEFDSACEDICREHYKEIWHTINDRYFSGKADKACANPARLTRRPGAVRSNGNAQVLLFENNGNKITKAGPLFRIIWRGARARLAIGSVIATTTTETPSNSGLKHDNMCQNYDVIQHYLNTSYPKLTGNGDSSISLFRAVRCCIKYNDSATLEKVLTKAKSEHWSDTELNRLQTNIRNKYV
ncbi:MAG: hypothetical protein MJZ37_07005 [Bacilli bacterium]|nr:hypothetical protein [Bacilli bacterium]